MGVGITDPGHVAIYDTVTDWAFGVVFHSAEHASDFLRWLGEEQRAEVLPTFATTFEAWKDPRCYDNNVLERLQGRWSRERTDEEGDLLPLLHEAGA